MTTRQKSQVGYFSLTAGLYSNCYCKCQNNRSRKLCQISAATSSFHELQSEDTSSSSEFAAQLQASSQPQTTHLIHDIILSEGYSYTVLAYLCHYSASVPALTWTQCIHMTFDVSLQNTAKWPQSGGRGHGAQADWLNCRRDKTAQIDWT